MKGPVVGAGIDRVDARLKVTGEATYAADVPVAKVAHAVIATSGVAHGSLLSIDVAAASRAPGVIGVITHANAPKLHHDEREAGRPPPRVLQLLQDDVLHYSDQPIAIVVADTLERAQQAVALVAPRYTSEAPVADLVANLGAAYTPKRAGPVAEPDTSRGSVATGLAAAVTKLSATYTTPVENHNPMEPPATTAVWHGNDHVTLYDATQGIFAVRQRIADLFGLPKENVRVVNHYVGGAFGCKGTPWSHVALAAMAAKVVGRPVKLVVTRQQMYSLIGHRPQTVQTIELGCDPRGKLTAIRHDVVSETSRFDEYVEPSAVVTRMLYACPNVITTHKLVRIDIPTPTFQRAPGESTGTYALESAMDELAVAAQLDPLELRLRNYAQVDPHEGKPWSSKSLRECYRAAAEKFGWSRRTPQPRSMRAAGELVGWGMATASYPAYMWAAGARARLRADGSVLVQAGTQDLGTGTYTVMTQIAADALGVPIDRVSFELGDTTFPETPVSGGSITAGAVGSAVKMACGELVRNLARLAVVDPTSPLHGMAADGLGAEHGELFAKADPTRRDPLARVVAGSNQTEVTAEVRHEASKERDAYSCHSFGADFVEVRVDEELGRIRVARIVAAFAAGKFLNAKTARSQLMGGLVWAIGMALQEHTVRDLRTARVVTRDLADYHVPVNADVPDLDVILIDEVDPHVNEIGVKGIGEIGITGATAAIANAVFHATGKRVRNLPITVDKLL